MNLLQAFDHLDAMAMNLTKPLLISEDKVRLVIYFVNIHIIQLANLCTFEPTLCQNKEYST